MQDNGAGISPDDYDTIALKHYTSKLSTYDDLSSLRTFGFRGEALSSLCALSKFYIITARASDGAKGTKLEFEQSGKLKGTSVVAAKQGTTVVVESLFHNLPVRRKQLEKTVKREYNNVLHLLHQYACISTGVKFNVSNQISKGKKTVAFSTNANPSTKENIANVYGTKMLLTLIPLNLKFEMDSTNRPGGTQSARNWSTQENPDSHAVQIVGHMSRPVVGEGRQTPDRQMFFVNSRPCSLPQVAKAFNEVYRSYNITQSPFVLADIRLDTEAYDVNVSPDKRTIMLHDQTALLESLKEALVQLFQTHDQSVPQAQSLLKRTPSLPGFRPPVIQQRDSMESPSEEQIGSDRSAEPCKLSSTFTEHSGSSVSSEVTSLPGFTKASLIERFAGRDVEERSAPPRPGKRRSVSSENLKATAETAVRHSAGLACPPLEAKAVRTGPNARSPTPLFDPERAGSIELLQVEQPPKPVQDFNARMASQHAKQLERARSSKSASPDEVEDEENQGIPVIKQTPRKSLSQSTMQNAFDRMRPIRTPVQQATITIGDTTTVSTIGSGSQTRLSKRARIHTPKFGLDGTPLRQTPKKPLITKSLRGFAAPGTQFEESEDEEEEVAQDSSMLDVPVRSSSSRERSNTRDLEEPRTDDADISSGAPSSPEPPVDTDLIDLEDPVPELHVEDDALDGEYIDESENKAREEAKIAKMIAETEEAIARPTEMNLKRAGKLFKTSHKKYLTKNLERNIDTDIADIATHIHNLTNALEDSDQDTDAANLAFKTQLNKQDPEERLSLTVTKQDFNNMRIIGQFNLGFILAVRPPTRTSPTPDLFIIDQHASDEKYNFEELSATTILVSQRLVHPHSLELTAVEEEIILANQHSLTANGFIVEMDTSGSTSVGHRAKLTSLPMSKEVTFTPTDLEELIALAMDDPSPSSSISTSPHIPRPSKVRKLLASRACRKSVMIGKTLRSTQMESIVRHMGSMDKPWSCPHGRPTMRHLYGLDTWEGWSEGDGMVGLGEVGMQTDWGRYLNRMQG